MTQRNPHIARNLKATREIIFRQPLSIESSLHVQKSKCRLLFVMIGKNAHYFYSVYCAGTMQNKLPKGIPMFKTLKSIWQGLTQKGKIFPHQLAFTLLIPLRNWALSPQQIVQRLHLAPHHRILEVGCGAGYFSPTLAQSVPQGRLVAADIQPEMLAYTEKRLRRRHIENVDYYLCDGAHFDFPDQSFDRIVLITVLGEVSNQTEYLTEFRRLLRPDGLLSVSETAGDPDKPSRAELRELMRQNGFDVADEYGSERNFTLNFKVACTER